MKRKLRNKITCFIALSVARLSMSESNSMDENVNLVIAAISPSCNFVIRNQFHLILLSGWSLCFYETEITYTKVFIDDNFLTIV